MTVHFPAKVASIIAITIRSNTATQTTAGRIAHLTAAWPDLAATL